MKPPARHSVSVAAAIVDDHGRILALRRRDNGHWEPPGGVLEMDESITGGLRREVEEETGLTIEPGPLTGVYKNLPQGIVALVFRCTAVGGTLTPTAEAQDFKWLGPDEIAELMSEAYAVRLLDALADDGPKIRTHDGVFLVER